MSHVGSYKARLNKISATLKEQSIAPATTLQKRYPLLTAAVAPMVKSFDTLPTTFEKLPQLVAYFENDSPICCHTIQHAIIAMGLGRNKPLKETFAVVIGAVLTKYNLETGGDDKELSFIVDLLSGGCVLWDKITPYCPSSCEGVISELEGRKNWDSFCDEHNRGDSKNLPIVITRLERLADVEDIEPVEFSFVGHTAAKYDE